MSKSGAKQKKKTKFDRAAMADTNKQTPEQAARYLAFADPTQPKVKAMLASVLMKDKKAMLQEEKEAEQKRLIGILKAAEARNRLRNSRLQYQALRAQEINFLISFQRNAKGAVRLEVFLPPSRNLARLSDCMDTVQRGRIEEILEDENALQV